MCDCVKCVAADVSHALDFVMWRSECGWSLVRFDVVVVTVK